MRPFMLFDDALSGQALLLHDFEYEDVLPDTADVDACLRRGWARGLHAGVVAEYGFGAGLMRTRTAETGVLRLLWFARKSAPADVRAWLAAQGAAEGVAGISRPQPDTDGSSYARTVADIHAAIARGDTYQINYTHRLHLSAYGPPVRLYARLRQAVPYGALLRLPERAGGDDWVLCFSPELFLRVGADGTVCTEPMKGTAPRLGDDGDAARAAALRADPKNRAENTMIVDLLRNDLGKIAQTGSVCVPEPFKVSPFGAVWQMTSTVCARMREGTSFAALLEAAFPCGSITGAPKRKSMDIIAERETSPRGLYTGSIGFLTHDPQAALGFTACLNVVIRTLCLRRSADSPAPWRGVYGVGSGIVADACAADEYQECAWKARLLTGLRPECGIFETMRVENGTVAAWAAHRARLAESAGALNIPLDLQAAEHAVQQASAVLPAGVWRLRLDVSPEGAAACRTAPLVSPAAARAYVSDTVLPDRDPVRRHKTTRREVFDAVWREAEAQGAFDALLFNRSGWLLEGGRSSVMIEYRGEKLIPAADLDVLHGIARRSLPDHVRQARISRSMLAQADAVYLGNALHGWFPVKLMWKRDKP
ncbi:bifunctional chorismate-binding protein/class IV aminotransferase [Conchiformibius kuhniae]|uniref:Chorismate-binding protein n=1 Tax=Conchiformibius kuhniae TaxID=211502 RepID=A0ABD8B756_9NEIS|nr:bifunctional chorismate-binding protein/class IV aminotransferase [Conchiformibius kuhniae]